MVRAKFRVSKVSQVDWSKDVRIVAMTAVCADGVPENERFSRATPSGSLEMMIDNPPAAEQLQLGKTFYVDFTPAE